MQDQDKPSSNEDQTVSEQPPEPRLIVKRKTNPVKAVLYFILAAMLIVLAAFGGWWYGQEQAKTSSESKISELEQKIKTLEKNLADVKESNTTETTDQTQTPGTVNPNEYIVVQEWGIKIKATEAAKYTYKISNEASTDPMGNKSDATLHLLIKPEYLQTKTCNELGVALTRIKHAQTSPQGAALINGNDYLIYGAPGLCPGGTDNDIFLGRQFTSNFKLDNVTAL